MFYAPLLSERPFVMAVQPCRSIFAAPRKTPTRCAARSLFPLLFGRQTPVVARVSAEPCRICGRILMAYQDNRMIAPTLGRVSVFPGMPPGAMSNTGKPSP